MTAPAQPVIPARNDAGTRRQCPVCWASFTPAGTQIFCSTVCRKTAWRRRHQDHDRPAPAPAPAGRPRRDVTVYQCDDCDQRSVGEQWCPDCNRPCRRVGLGGRCPGCDEPVAIADLLDTPTEVPQMITNHR